MAGVMVAVLAVGGGEVVGACQVPCVCLQMMTFCIPMDSSHHYQHSSSGFVLEK